MRNISKDKSKKNKYNTNFKNKQYSKKKRNYKTHNIQKGGDKLGAGSYGCVVTPPIPCNNQKMTKRFISKLIKIGNESDKSEINNEIRISKILQKLDKRGIYFGTILQDCDLRKIQREDLSYLSKDKKSRSKCYIDLKKKYINLIQKNVGKNFEDILEGKEYNIKKLINLKFRFIVKHLLEGLRKIHSSEIAYLDIKPDNMGIRLQNKKLYVSYIDFGVSYVYLGNIPTKFGTDIFQFIGTPGYINPEMYVIYLICNRIEKTESISDLFNPKVRNSIVSSAYKHVNNDSNTYLMTELKLNRKRLRMTEDDTHFLDKLKGKEQPVIDINDILQLYIKIATMIKANVFVKEYHQKYNGIVYKGDIYSLGISFCQMMVNVEYENEELLDLIRNMINPNPFQRYNINQCLNHPYVINN